MPGLLPLTSWNAVMTWPSNEWVEIRRSRRWRQLVHSLRPPATAAPQAGTAESPYRFQPHTRNYPCLLPLNIRRFRTSSSLRSAE